MQETILDFGRITFAKPSFPASRYACISLAYSSDLTGKTHFAEKPLCHLGSACLCGSKQLPEGFPKSTAGSFIRMPLAILNVSVIGSKSIPHLFFKNRHEKIHPGCNRFPAAIRRGSPKLLRQTNACISIRTGRLPSMEQATMEPEAPSGLTAQHIFRGVRRFSKTIPAHFKTPISFVEPKRFSLPEGYDDKHACLLQSTEPYPPYVPVRAVPATEPSFVTWPTMKIETPSPLASIRRIPRRFPHLGKQSPVRSQRFR